MPATRYSLRSDHDGSTPPAHPGTPRPTTRARRPNRTNAFAQGRELTLWAIAVAVFVVVLFAVHSANALMAPGAHY